MTIKLTYFGGKGRAEPCRLAFHIGGVAFEDERINFEQFMALKPKLPFGTVPAVTVDNVQSAQSAAILRYAGKLGGLYPADPVQALQVDCFLDGLTELLNAISKSYGMQDPEVRKAARQDISAGLMVNTITYLERLIQGDYVMGSTMTIADLAVYSAEDLIVATDDLDDSQLNKFPKFRAVAERVRNHPKVKEWNERHATSG